VAWCCAEAGAAPLRSSVTAAFVWSPPDFIVPSELASDTLAVNTSDAAAVEQHLLQLTNEDEPHAALALHLCQEQYPGICTPFSNAAGELSVQVVYAFNSGHAMPRIRLAGLPRFANVACDASLTFGLSQTLVSGAVSRVSGVVLPSRETCPDCAPCVVIVAQAEQPRSGVQAGGATFNVLVLPSVAAPLRGNVLLAAAMVEGAVARASNNRYPVKFALRDARKATNVSVNPFTPLEAVLGAEKDVDLVVSRSLSPQPGSYHVAGGRHAGFVANVGTRGAWLVLAADSSVALIADRLAAIVVHDLGVRPPLQCTADYATLTWLSSPSVLRALGWASSRDYVVFDSSADKDTEVELASLRGPSGAFVRYPLGLVAVELRSGGGKGEVHVSTLLEYTQVRFPPQSTCEATLAAAGEEAWVGDVRVRLVQMGPGSARVQVHVRPLQCAPVNDCAFPTPLPGKPGQTYMGCVPAGRSGETWCRPRARPDTWMRCYDACERDAVAASRVRNVRLGMAGSVAALVLLLSGAFVFFLRVRQPHRPRRSSLTGAGGGDRRPSLLAGDMFTPHKSAGGGRERGGSLGTARERGGSLGEPFSTGAKGGSSERRSSVLKAEALLDSERTRGLLHRKRSSEESRHSEPRSAKSEQ